MGFGMYIGNMSVHWAVVHEDGSGRAVQMASKQGQAAHPKRGHDVHVDKGARGIDPVEIADAGRDKGHPGCFRVRLRFNRVEEARAAAAAAQGVREEDGMFVLVLDVPVIKRKEADDPPAAEVRVDW
jgi:hypothetical protein